MGYDDSVLEFNVIRKHKICLADYDFKQDIDNRIVMAEFTANDLAVLQEILYSPLHTSARKLARNCALSLEDVTASLNKLAKSKLVSVHGDAVDVDKRMRKYFESEVNKFDEEFKPGMEYLFQLLKKVPIHVLPMWYAVPRTSNNIFESLIEKYLLTPQIYQRHLTNVRLYEPELADLMDAILHAPEGKVKARDLIERFQLSRSAFEEQLLLMEFHFVCCVCYEKVGDVWEEIITPFYEWREYLEFLRSTEAVSINDVARIERFRPKDFAFVEDMKSLLQYAKKRPIALEQGRTLPAAPLLQGIAEALQDIDARDPKFLTYFERLVDKAQLLKLAEIVDGKLYALDAANTWLDMPPENRALFFYRHPLNRLSSDGVPLHLCTEKVIREAEKSIQRVLHSGWVLFEDFLRGVTVHLNESLTVMLQKRGRCWQYQLPQYAEEEIAVIRAVVLDWLFEAGIVAVGTYEGKECFAVTPFGQSLYT